MSHLWLRNRQQRFPVRLRAFRRFALSFLDRALEGRPFELGLQLLGPRAMARVNFDHLHHEGPTDVITFDYAEPGVPSPCLHGDILICPAVAASQARAFGTDWREEVLRYMVHGVLHLQGYDDRTSSVRRVMKRRENRWMRQLLAHFPITDLGPTLNL